MQKPSIEVRSLPGSAATRSESPRVPALAFFTLSLLVGVILVAGCNRQRMAVPIDVKTPDTQEWPVERVELELYFADWTVGELNRAWDPVAGGLVVEGVADVSGFSFVVKKDSGEAAAIECATSTGAVSEASTSFLHCVINGEGINWNLEMTGQGLQPMIGRLSTLGKTVYEVEGSNELSDQAEPVMTTTGYMISRGTDFVGAVDVLEDGVVWLFGALPATEELPFGALAAILLRQGEIATVLAAERQDVNSLAARARERTDASWLASSQLSSVKRATSN